MSKSVCLFVRVSVFPVFSVTNFLGLIGDALGEVNWRSPRRRGRAQLATPSANSAKLIGEALGEGVELEGQELGGTSPWSLQWEECTKNWHEHGHCSSEYDLFGMSVNIAVGASHNETSTVG